MLMGDSTNRRCRSLPTDPGHLLEGLADLQHAEVIAVPADDLYADR